MNNRAKIEADLAKAETHLAKEVMNLIETRAEIARTERAKAAVGASLPMVVSNLAKAKAAAVDREDKIASVRAYCSRLSVALEKLNREEGRPNGYRSEPNVDALEGSPQVARKDRRNAGTLDNPGVNRRKPGNDRHVTRPNLANRNLAKPVVGSNAPLDRVIKGTASNQKVGIAANRSERGASPHSKQASIRTDVSRRVLAWQAVELLSLTLAYLQYYLLDVSLQVARLPSVGVLWLG